MVRLVVHRLLRLVGVVLGATLITFVLMHLIPGNPWSNYSSSPRMMAGVPSDDALQSQLSRHFGLDLPLWRQFTRYVLGDVERDGTFTCGALCGNLGPSIRQRGRTVQEVLFEPPPGLPAWKSRFGYSLRLVLLGSLIALGLGIPLGLLSAMRGTARARRTFSIALAAVVSVPNFVLALLAIVVLASWLKLIKVLPDWNVPADWLIPGVVLALAPMASIARVTRSSLINVMNEDFVRTARGKGLRPSRIMVVHVLRVAVLPIITFLGPTLIEMFVGLFVVENLYGFPGFGREYWEAILWLDYPMILGLTVVYAVGIALVNILVEIACEILDPRIRAVAQPGAA